MGGGEAEEGTALKLICLFHSLFSAQMVPWHRVTLKIIVSKSFKDYCVKVIYFSNANRFVCFLLPFFRWLNDLKSPAGTIRLRAVPFDITIVQAYAPTSDYDDNEIEEFFYD